MIVDYQTQDERPHREVVVFNGGKLIYVVCANKKKQCVRVANVLTTISFDVEHITISDEPGTTMLVWYNSKISDIDIEV